PARSDPRLLTGMFPILSCRFASMVALPWHRTAPRRADANNPVAALRGHVPGVGRKLSHATILSVSPPSRFETHSPKVRSQTLSRRLRLLLRGQFPPCPYPPYFEAVGAASRAALLGPARLAGPPTRRCREPSGTAGTAPLGSRGLPRPASSTEIFSFSPFNT